MDITLFYITIPNQEAGEAIAHHLLDKNLIACANILPAHTSIYRWQGKVESESEHVMILKTYKDRTQQVEDVVSELHPYDTPCILQIEPSQANSAFIDWAEEQTRG